MALFLLKSGFTVVDWLMVKLTNRLYIWLFRSRLETRTTEFDLYASVTVLIRKRAAKATMIFWYQPLSFGLLRINSSHENGVRAYKTRPERW